MKNLALVLTVLLYPLSVYAQSELGGSNLNGTVTDPSGAVVIGATVKLTSEATGFTRVTQSNGAGLYNFVRVPVGAGYVLSVEQSGFRTARQEGIRLDVGAVVTLDVALQVGANSEVVSVAADIPIVETGRSQTATTVNERAVADLPVNGRNFIDFTRLTPGVVTDPTRGGDLSFGGQRGPANSLLVDGAESNSVFFGQAVGRTGFRPYSFSQDAVQEFQVNTNDYPAEIGRAGGGVINVVTKSGTNAVHGTAFEFYRDKALNANTFTNNRGNTDLGIPNSSIPKQPYHFNQFGGSLGGPVIKDKLFFFLNYDGQRNTAPQVVIPSIPVPANLLPQLGQYLTPYTTGANNDVGLVKFDWNIDQRQRFYIRYNINRFTGTNYENTNLNAVGTTSSQSHTGDSQVATDNIAMSYSRVFGSNVIFDARYTFIRDNEPGVANSANPEVSIVNGPIFGRNNFSPRYTDAKDNQGIFTLSVVHGRHTVKFGTDINREAIANFFPGYFSGSYTFPSYAAFAAGQPSQFIQGFAGAGTSGPLTQPNVLESTFFAQDSWRVTERLTLNYGIRYDIFKYAQPPVLNNDPGLLATGIKTNVVPVDYNNVAPRFGFAYKPFSSDRVVLRGGYGIFYGRTPSILIGTAFSQNGIQVRNYTLTPASPFFPTYPNILASVPAIGLSPNLFVMQPNFVSPLTHQYSFNLEMAVTRDLSITLGYLGVRGEHLARTRDTNLLPEVATEGTFANGTPITFYRHPGTNGNPVRPNPAFGRISVFDSGADSTYNGGFIQVNKRFAQRYQFLASYTFSKVIDTVPDATAVTVGGGDDAKEAQDTLQPNNDRGPGSADIRHRFVFSGVWDIDYANSLSNPFLKYTFGGWQLSTIAQIQSGRRFNALVSGDPNNDQNLSSDRVPGAGRNTIQGPLFETVDLRISRDIPLYRERVRLRLLGEAFNLTNRANFNGLQNTQYTFTAATRVYTPRTDFLRPVSTFDPRILQLAVKLIF
ncbi:MAG: TonB-dependent receptor [Acidobacteriota bacterium]|nr:TonB-dependent receptor [Acidobacteriota bacterium]